MLIKQAFHVQGDLSLTSLGLTTIGNAPPNSSFNSDDYNPIEWAKIMVEAKTIIGKPTGLAKEYNTITNEEGISK